MEDIPECKKMKADISDLKAKSHSLSPVIQIGKNGLSDEAINQIKSMLRKKNLIKVKFLKSYLETTDKRKAVQELAERTGALVVHKVGFIVVLYKE